MRRPVVMRSPLGYAEVEAWVVTDDLGVIANPNKWVVDQITKQMTRAPGGDFEVVLLRHGVGVSPRMPTLYEALTYANYLAARHAWDDPLGDPMATRAALRNLRVMWERSGGYLGAPL